MKTYDREYYEERQRRTQYSARAVLEVLLAHCTPLASAVDVGCGVGTWLSVLREKGITDIQGVDGPWVEPDLLVIPQDRFRRADLGEPLSLGRRFDLAISLEVAEHLPPDRAAGFVATLTDLSDQVLFSAAVPRQGGSRHLNEQWQSYWAKLFDARGYEVHDVIRSRIWGDEQIPYWYRQNTLFYKRRSPTAQSRPESLLADAPPMPLDLVHPFLFLKRVKPRRRRLKERLSELLRPAGR